MWGMQRVQATLEARLMVCPAATYERLSAETAARTRGLLRRRLLWLAFVIGCFLSFTTSGQLSARHLIDGMVCWSFVPLLNLVLAGAFAHRFSRHDPRAAVDGYFAAFGPWLVWLVAIAGIGVWWPPASTEVWLLPLSAAALLALAVAWGWSSWIQYRCLTILWRLPAPGALALLAGMKLGTWGTVALFFLASDQMEPRMGWLLG